MNANYSIFQDNIDLLQKSKEMMTSLKMENENICTLNARIVWLQKENESLSAMNERISLLEKENELIPVLNEKIAIVGKENNVLVKKNNEILEIVEREKENYHALCVRERETSKKVKDIQDQVDLIERKNKTLSKEMSSKHLENSTLQESVAALKKENSEAMKLAE